MHHFQVLFSGDIASGADEQTVRARLARELGIDERKSAALFSGRTVVIRAQLSHEDALALHGRLADLGALCRIKDLTPRPREQQLDHRIDREDRRGDHTLRDITAAHLECPRCGHMQLEASHCARCGVDIAASLKAKRKEDLIIEKKIRDLKLTQARDASPVAQPRAQIRATQPLSPRHDEKKTGKIKSWLRKIS